MDAAAAAGRGHLSHFRNRQKIVGLATGVEDCPVSAVGDCRRRAMLPVSFPTQTEIFLALFEWYSWRPAHVTSYVWLIMMWVCSLPYLLTAETLLMTK